MVVPGARQRFRVKALVRGRPHSRDVTRVIHAEDEQDARAQFSALFDVITFHWIRPATQKKRWEK